MSDTPRNERPAYDEATEALRRAHTNLIDALLAEFDRLKRELLQAQESIARLEGRLCLVCGASAPCKLKDDALSPCTFDPSPIEAAQRFHKQANDMRAERDRLRELLRVNHLLSRRQPAFTCDSENCSQYGLAIPHVLCRCLHDKVLAHYEAVRKALAE